MHKHKCQNCLKLTMGTFYDPQTRTCQTVSLMRKLPALQNYFQPSLVFSSTKLFSKLLCYDWAICSFDVPHCIHCIERASFYLVMKVEQGKFGYVNHIVFVQCILKSNPIDHKTTPRRMCWYLSTLSQNSNPWY